MHTCIFRLHIPTMIKACPMIPSLCAVPTEVGRVPLSSRKILLVTLIPCIIALIMIMKHKLCTVTNTCLNSA